MLRASIIAAALMVATLAHPAQATADGATTVEERSALTPRASALEWDYVTDDTWLNGRGYCSWLPSDPYGLGCWEADGDDVQVGDAEKDGFRVAAHWRTDYGRRGMCVNNRGNDTVVLDQPEQVGKFSCNDLNLAEGSKIQLRVGKCNGSKVDCTVFSNWGSWAGWTAYFTI